MKIRRVVEQVLPALWQRAEVRQIRARIALRERKDQAGTALDASWEDYLELPRPDLQDSLKAELSRREFVHRRAQTFLSSIAVMTAFTIGAASALRSNEHVIPPWVIAPAIVIAFLYLASGGWYALATVRPGLLYDLFLQGRMHDSSPKTDDDIKRTLLALIQINQAHSLVFAALAERTYRSIRNGLIALVVVLSMLVGDAATLRFAQAPRASHSIGAGATPR